MVDSGTVKQLSYRANLGERINKLSHRARLLFAADITERLLPAAEEPLTKWRSDAWTTHRSALDRVWQHLGGRQAPMHEYENLRKDCIDKLPHSEDPNWRGGIGALEATVAVVSTLDVLIDSDPEAAVNVSDEAIHAIEVHLSKKMFPDAILGDQVDYDAIFNSSLMQAEFQRENRILGRLEDADCSEEEIRDAAEGMKEEAKNRPIELR